MSQFKEYLTFDDCYLIPQFSYINSRKDVDLFTRFGQVTYTLPIMSANMDSITDVEMCRAMYKKGGVGCLHRFMEIEENVLKSADLLYEDVEFFCSIGVGEKEFLRYQRLLEVGVRNFIIDVANGAQKQVVEFYKQCKNEYSENYIVVGNFASKVSIEKFIEELGYAPDAVKIGIGPGSNCQTRIVAGVGVPQLSALLECSTIGIPMIADGGMVNSGAMVKALAVPNVICLMIGSPLAGTEETPGDIFSDQGNKVAKGFANNGYHNNCYKVYRGSASKESYKDQGKQANHRAAEGITRQVPYKGKVSKVLQELEAGIRSGFTYCNATSIKDLQSKAQWCKITPNGLKEGKPSE